MDIHHTLKRCRQLDMMSALVYIYNRGLHDYSSPLTEILLKVSENCGSEQSMQHIYTLFVYIAYSLTGKAFPVGELNERESEEASRKVFAFLLSPTYIQTPEFILIHREASGCLEERFHSSFQIGMEPWPYFNYLLGLDTREFLKVLSQALSNGLLDVGIAFEGNSDGLLITRQYIFNVTLHLARNSSFSPFQADCIYSFLGRAYHLHHRVLSFSRDQLTEIFNALLGSQVEGTLLERESSLMALYDSGYAPLRADADFEVYLERFEKAGFWRIYERLVLRDYQFGLALMSYLRAPNKLFVFDAIRRWLKTWPEREEEIKGAVYLHLVDLVSEGMELAALIEEYWWNDHELVLHHLDNSAKDQFKYLEGLLHPRQLFPKTFVQRPPNHSQHLHITYIDLLSTWNPCAVLKYFEFAHDYYTELPFDLASALKIVESKKLRDAQIWVLLEMKKFHTALSLFIDLFFERRLIQEGSEESLHQAIEKAIQICSWTNEISLWKDLLDRLCFHLPNTPFYQEIQKRIVSNAMAHMPIPDILIRLLDQHSGEVIGRYRTLIDLILTSSQSQIDNINYTLQLSQSHHFEKFNEMVKVSKSSFHPMLGQCQLCRKLLHLRKMTLVEQKENVTVFRCCHAFHEECLSKVLEKAHKQMRLTGKVEDYDQWFLTLLILGVLFVGILQPKSIKAKVYSIMLRRYLGLSHLGRSLYRYW
jgi:hypothetical protein